MDKETIELNKSQGREHLVPCQKCNGETYHKVLISADLGGGDSSWGYYYEERYQVIQCQGCRKLSFRKSQTNSEDSVEDEEGETLYVLHEELYPSRVTGRHKLSDAYLLPFPIVKIYEETYYAICNKQPILAGIGIRALIEAVCKEKAAQGKNLEDKIDSLVTIGVLTKDGADILHSLRILGNLAAHEIKPHSEQTLSIAMDVVEHLLIGVYILPKVAANLPKRKDSGML
jgi:hypothetical protein